MLIALTLSLCVSTAGAPQALHLPSVGLASVPAARPPAGIRLADAGTDARVGLQHARLLAELAELKENAPSIGGAVAKVVVGVVFIGVGAGLFLGLSYAVSPLMGLLGLIPGVIGVILVVVGAIQIPLRIAGKVVHSKRVRDLEEEIEKLEKSAPAGIPSTAQRPWPALRLASF